MNRITNVIRIYLNDIYSAILELIMGKSVISIQDLLTT